MRSNLLISELSMCRLINLFTSRQNKSCYKSCLLPAVTLNAKLSSLISGISLRPENGERMINFLLYFFTIYNNNLILGQHDGIVVSTVACQQECPGFDTRLG